MKQIILVMIGTISKSDLKISYSYQIFRCFRMCFYYQNPIYIKLQSVAIKNIKQFMYRPKLNSAFNLQDFMLDESLLKIILPGDLITDEEGYMNGHGTYASKGKIYSSVLGNISKTNKLIIVNPLNSRYHPQVGDIVVGRVVQILNKRWKVDINASALAFLHLNAMYMPDHRKKTQLDELNMRKVLAENDLLVAEVHSINNDRTINLHTPNAKYGSLQPGLLVEVNHKLIKRQKHHLTKFGNVFVLLGNNGKIYLTNKNREDLNIKTEDYSQQQLKQISLINSILKVVDFQGLEISEGLVKDLMQYSDKQKLQPSQIMYENGLEEYIRQLMKERIPKKISQLSKHVSLN